METGAVELFTTFVGDVGAGLRRAFISMYGPEVAAEVTADALAYAWEHWERMQQMTNPSGYLFRVGQSRSRRDRSGHGRTPARCCVRCVRRTPTTSRT